MSDASLTSKTCTPCQGGIPPLDSAEARGYAKAVPQWSLVDDDKRIERTFSFGSFKEAFDFVGKVAEVAETEGHHPDVTFGWGYATVSLQTKKIKGLHENDFIMAAKLDQAAG